MKLSRLQTWAERADDTSELKAELEEQMLRTHDQIDRLRSWEGVEEWLREEQQQAFKDMMSVDIDQILVAREKAKMISKLLQKKDDLEKELDRLRAERNSLEE